MSTDLTGTTSSAAGPRVVHVPEGIHAIDVPWMANALGSGSAGDALTAVSVEQIGQDSGHLGTSARVTLSYAQGPTVGPPTVVVKMAADSPESLETARRGHLYEREHHFFTQLAPRTDVRAPVCFAAGYDDASGLFVLVLEDVRAHADYDQIEGCSLRRAEQVVRQLARLHASWWESPELHTHGWLTSFVDEARIVNMRRLLAQGWPLLCAELGDRLVPEAIHVGAAVLDHFAPILHGLDQHSQTLLHGDTRLDNFMFDAGVARAPVVLLDWQNVSRGPAVAEIGYFLAQNLTADDFATHLDPLLGIYCEELAVHGGGTVLPTHLRDALWESLPITFVVAAAMFVMADLTRPRAVELAAVMAERAVAAAQTLDIADRLAGLAPRAGGSA
jgi:hypothetical protein